MYIKGSKGIDWLSIYLPMINYLDSNAQKIGLVIGADDIYYFKNIEKYVFIDSQKMTLYISDNSSFTNNIFILNSSNLNLENMKSGILNIERVEKLKNLFNVSEF
jgi:hypothetical protein